MPWWVEWALGLPMIMITLGFHAGGLVLIAWVMRTIERRRQRAPSLRYFLVMTLTAANAALALLIAESAAWAALYVEVGALSTFSDALLYSFNAITSYGHEHFGLSDPWELLGALEAVGGVMIFGLTTAFLFTVMSRVHPLRDSPKSTVSADQSSSPHRS